MKWYSKAMSNYFNFYDRATRQEYWWFIFFMFVFGLGAMLLDNLFGTTFRYSTPEYYNYNYYYNYGSAYGWIYIIYYLAHFFPWLAAMTRRLHDCNKSGWWIFWSYTPVIIIGTIYWIILSNISYNNSDSIVIVSVFSILMIFSVLTMIGLGITILVFHCLPGTPGANTYGPPLDYAPQHYKYGQSYQHYQPPTDNMPLQNQGGSLYENPKGNLYKSDKPKKSEKKAYGKGDLYDKK